MMNELTINDRNRTIEMTKKFANAAKRYGSREYEDLQNARKDYPRYKVVTRSTKKNNNNDFKGLTFAYMERYIKDHSKDNSKDSSKDNLLDFYTLCGRNKEGKKLMLDGKKMIEHASYREVKEWFLKTYPEIEKYPENVKNILNKKTA